jgi:predicted amidohydrolase YtcJ
MSAALVLKDANVITMERAERVPYAQAVAVDEGRIVAVGTDDEIEPLIGSGTKVLSLQGKTVMPGFIDTHIHFMETGLSGLGPGAYGVTSTEQVVEILVDAGRRSETDQLVWIRGCRIGELDRPLTAKEVDRAAPQNPVVIPGLGGHSFVLNTQAWDSLGMSADTPGVRIDPDTGKPTGMLVGEANSLARFHFYSMMEDSTRVAAFYRGAEMAAQAGLTTVHALEGGSPDGHGWVPERDVEVLLRERENLLIRTVVYFQSTRVQRALDLGLPRIGGCLLVDGAYAEHTAALLEPYTDDETTKGVLYFSDEELNDFVGRAHRAGLQVSMHAIGDAAIEQLLNAYEHALAEYPRPDHRHRIEHFSLPTPEHVERAAGLGVALGMQPIFASMPKAGEAGSQPPGLEFLGPERYARRHPYRTIVDAGIMVAGGSDSEKKPESPMVGIHAVVNHPDEERRLTVMEALSLFTTNAAKIAFEEGEKGSIEPGKLADLVILGGDPLTADLRTLEDIPVLMTIVGGEIAYHSHLA